jgi:putative DNA primase/helicase
MADADEARLDDLIRRKRQQVEAEPKLISSPDSGWLRPKVITPEPDLLQYGAHDTGNAQRILELFGSDLRYCYPWRKWLEWDSERWAVDTRGDARRKAKLTMAKFLQQALEANNLSLAAFAKKSLNAVPIANALSLAEPELAIMPDELDRDPWVLNCRNTTVDLRTGECLGHDRAHLITKLVPHDFDPAAECPQWLRFLRNMMAGNETMVQFLQLALGYSLTGSTRERAIFVLFGPSGTGKTTFLTTIREALGEYATLIAVDSLMTGKISNGVNSDLADLARVRFAMSSEPEQDQKLSPSKLKRLTQGVGRIKARRLYENVFSFEESHHLWVDTNVRPEIPGADAAVFARLHAIPCFVQISKEQMDKNLIHKLREEFPGILAWLVRGAQQWYETGLPRPPEVESATNSWRESCDQLEQFLLARCVVGAGLSVLADKIFAAYKTWCKESKDEAVSATAFGLRLSQKFDRKRTNKGVLYLGIGLKSVGL